MKEDEFCLEYIHRNMRWQYFSQIVKKYNKLEDFRRKE